MEKPKNYDNMLKRYNELKNLPMDKLTTNDLSVIMIVEIQIALEGGTKHIHPKTGEILKNVNDVIKTLIEHQTIEIIPPKR
jgi:hypothetical protein